MKLSINYPYNIRGWNVIIEDNSTENHSTHSAENKVTEPKITNEMPNTKCVSNPHYT